jgi:hypothetical protein
VTRFLAIYATLGLIVGCALLAVGWTDPFIYVAALSVSLMGFVLGWWSHEDHIA